MYLSSSNIAETAYGEVEYSIKGEAPYVLWLHGTPGCHDGVYGESDRFVNRGFGVIAPSRPGYGRSNTGKKYPDQADACAALLDHLKVDKVVVYAV